MLLLGVEALVGWLLDHSDVQVTELSDADTVSDEYSDEEVVEDMDDAAYSMVSASCVTACTWAAVCLALWQSYTLAFSVS